MDRPLESEGPALSGIGSPDLPLEVSRAPDFLSSAALRFVTCYIVRSDIDPTSESIWGAETAGAGLIFLLSRLEDVDETGQPG